MKLAFIGTGVMGQPMAGHLLAAGHAVAVHNRTQSKARVLLDRGARWAASPAEASKDADVIFLCLSDSPDVKEACLGETGIAATAQRGAIVVDHSTISPAVTQEVAAELATKGVDFLDAPISGGDVGAKNATLAIMIGGSETSLRKVEPLLRLMGKTITHMGPVGHGQLTKCVNQILVTVNNLAMCEALTFAQKNGLNPEKTIEAIQGGAAGSWQLTNMAPRILKNDFRPGFTIDLQQKDLRIVMETAEKSEVSLLAASLVHQLLSAAQAAGHGHEGTQALYKVIEGLSHKH